MPIANKAPLAPAKEHRHRSVQRMAELNALGGTFTCLRLTLRRLGLKPIPVVCGHSKVSQAVDSLPVELKTLRVGDIGKYWGHH